MSYEGWMGNGTMQSARATWNVALWVDNDYGTYKHRMAEEPKTPEECEAFCREIFIEETPDGCQLDDVNWTEISDHWKDEYDYESPGDIEKQSPVVNELIKAAAEAEELIDADELERSTLSTAK